MIEKLDILAGKLGCTRGEFVRYLIDSAVSKPGLADELNELESEKTTSDKIYYVNFDKSIHLSAIRLTAPSACASLPSCKDKQKSLLDGVREFIAPG